MTPRTNLQKCSKVTLEERVFVESAFNMRCHLDKKILFHTCFFSKFAGWVANKKYIICFFSFSFFYSETPESAYVNAISSAGVIYKISYECDRGKIKNCGCTDEKHQQSIKHTLKTSSITDSITDEQKKTKKTTLYWSDCNDHLKYGIKMTKTFLDPSKEDTYNEHRKRNLKHLITIQNNRAARKVNLLSVLVFTVIPTQENFRKSTVEECILVYTALLFECRFNKNSLLQGYFLTFLPAGYSVSIFVL